MFNYIFKSKTLKKNVSIVRIVQELVQIVYEDSKSRAKERGKREGNSWNREGGILGKEDIILQMKPTFFLGGGKINN